MRQKRTIVSIITILALILNIFFVSTDAMAKKGSSSKKGSTSSSRSYSKSSKGSHKSVHVRGYTRKNGTHVAPYKRRPPRQ